MSGGCDISADEWEERERRALVTDALRMTVRQFSGALIETFHADELARQLAARGLVITPAMPTMEAGKR